ncbi:DsrE family protein [Paracoccus luteus]|uniref:DsrE family protein n=1 Tax=Paracoccus luteus TaxID=2508543 RepID=UPI00142FC491|nr:DsrE family protein [Paracoccus luteus]
MTPLNLIRLSAVALFLSASLALAQTAAPAAYAPQKVVYHLNQDGGEAGDGYRPALNNIENHLQAVGDDNIDLRVVMHGDGIGLLQHAAENLQLQGRVADLKNRGVDFLVCANTLTGRNIDPDDLFEVFDEDIVPSGVAEVARLQAEGFAYLRP